MDAALVNNWEEMSGTHYNTQPYANVFTSGCCVGGRMRLRFGENGLGKIVTLSRLLSGKRLLWLQADIISLLWAQSVFRNAHGNVPPCQFKVGNLLGSPVTG